jgi:hypothetical protein
MHESKSVRIGDVRSSGTAEMKVRSSPRWTIVLNAVTNTLSIGRILSIADPSMKELEGYILVTVGT